VSSCEVSIHIDISGHSTAKLARSSEVPNINVAKKVVHVIHQVILLFWVQRESPPPQEALAILSLVPVILRHSAERVLRAW